MVWYHFFCDYISAGTFATGWGKRARWHGACGFRVVGTTMPRTLLWLLLGVNKESGCQVIFLLPCHAILTSCCPLAPPSCESDPFLILSIYIYVYIYIRSSCFHSFKMLTRRLRLTVCNAIPCRTSQDTTWSVFRSQSLRMLH